MNPIKNSLTNSLAIYSKIDRPTEFNNGPKIELAVLFVMVFINANCIIALVSVYNVFTLYFKNFYFIFIQSPQYILYKIYHLKLQVPFVSPYVYPEANCARNYVKCILLYVLPAFQPAYATLKME